MRKLVLSLMAMLSIDGCSKVDNPNHCGFADGFCANSDAGSFCNRNSGQCEQKPLVIDNISPAIPSATATKVLIKGNGFYDITQFLSNGIDVLRSVSINSPTEMEVDLQSLLAVSGGSPFLSTKCGPVPVTITRKDGASVTAEEKIGRGFSRWKYEMPYATAAQSVSGVEDFSFANNDRKEFDYIYYMTNGSKATVGNQIRSTSTDSIGSAKIGYINIAVASPATVPFVLQSRTMLKAGIPSGSIVNKTAMEICDETKKYDLIAQCPISNIGETESLKLACISMSTADALKVKTLTLKLLAEISISNYKASKPIQSVSFAPNKAECAVAISSAPGVPSTVLPICDNKRSEMNPEVLTGFDLIGTFESVASINLAAQLKTRHYVLSKGLDSLVMEVFDTSLSNRLERFFVTPIVFKSDDIGTFSGSGAKIEVKDINCDDKMDVIIKTDRRVVAYLGISDTSWESTPKVLFEMPSTDANTTIKKAALWVPDYRSTAGVGVLGILDSNSNLSLYQQQ
jgi:hypothetical protein